MGKWSDWLNGDSRGDDPRKVNSDRNTRATVPPAEPRFYEDTHREGVYVGSGFNEPKTLPDKTQGVMPRQYQNVVVYAPKTPEDVQRLIDYLRRREPAIINLDGTEAEVAQRILDFTAGAIYALSGSIHRVATNIFLLSPEGVEITVPYDL